MESLLNQLQRFLPFSKTKKVPLVDPFCFFPDFAFSLFGFTPSSLVMTEVSFHCTFLLSRGPYLSNIDLVTFV